MTARGDTTALVVGAGPTGLAMASQLARHGMECRIVDEAPEPSGNSKAVVIQPRTLEVFDNMGVVDEVLDQGLRVHGLNLHVEGGRVAYVAYDQLDSPYPYAIDLPQAQTEALLSRYLGGLGVEVEWGTKLTGFSQDGNAVTTALQRPDGQDENVTSRWILGCDGAHSTVRQTLGLPFEGETMPQSFVVGDLKVDWTLPDDELHAFFHPDGLLAAFPIPGGRQRVVVEVATAMQEAPAEPTLADFQHWMQELGPAGAILSAPNWMTHFRVSFRRTPHYRQGRAFLAGDAAHIHSPAGAQGMNTCIQDTFNLAWKLALVDKGRAPDSLLDSYEVEREQVAKSVLEMTQLAGRVMTFRRPIGVKIRDRLLPLLAEQEVIQHLVVSRLSELPIAYRKSPIVAEYMGDHHGSPFAGLRFGSGPRAGDRAPDVHPLQAADAAITRLFDVLRTTKHTLLLFAGAQPTDDTWQRLAALADAIQARYSALIQVLGVAMEVGPAAGAMPLLCDPDGILQHRYGADSECLYLIRPDGYVGFRSRPAGADGLYEYLGQIFTAS